MMPHVHLPLHDHEERYGLFRSSWLAIAPKMLLGLAWTLLPFVLLFPILRLDWLGIVLAILFGAFGLRYLLAVRAGWYGSVLAVTNERVIDITKRGFGQPVVTSVSWKEVKGVRSGIRNSVLVDVGGEKPMTLVLAGAAKPKLVKELLIEVQSRQRR